MKRTPTEELQIAIALLGDCKENHYRDTDKADKYDRLAMQWGMILQAERDAEAAGLPDRGTPYKIRYNRAKAQIRRYTTKRDHARAGTSAQLDAARQLVDVYVTRITEPARI